MEKMMDTQNITEIDQGRLVERIAQIQAHRATHSAEHDVPNGKIHGYCIVCGVPFPCEYVGEPPAKTNMWMADSRPLLAEIQNLSGERAGFLQREKKLEADIEKLEKERDEANEALGILVRVKGERDALRKALEEIREVYGEWAATDSPNANDEFGRADEIAGDALSPIPSERRNHAV